MKRRIVVAIRVPLDPVNGGGVICVSVTAGGGGGLAPSRMPRPENGSVREIIVDYCDEAGLARGIRDALNGRL